MDLNNVLFQASLEDFQRICKFRGSHGLTREDFVSLVRPTKQDRSYAEGIFDELCEMCTALTGREMSELDGECMKVLYQSEAYSLCSDTVLSGNRLVQAVVEYFHKFDVSGDGRLQDDEFQSLIAALVSGMPKNDDPKMESEVRNQFKAEVQKIIAIMDTNEDGEIDLEEFVSGLLRLSFLRKQESMIGSFNPIHLDPGHTSAEEFVAFAEKYALENPITNHYFLKSFALGGFGSRTIDVGIHFMKAYHYFSRHFVEYVNGLISLVDDEEHKAYLRENSTEEEGNYDEATIRMITEAGISVDSVQGVPHRILFTKCLDAIIKRAQDLKLLDEEKYERASAAMVNVFQTACLEPSASAPKALGALYFGSELIVPRMYSNILQGFHSVATLTPDDLSFFRLHVDMDESHAAEMRQVVIDQAKTAKGRREMIESLTCVLDARAELCETIIQLSYESTSHGGEENSTLYNKQSTNWVRTTPTCLSDFTGRPVVFEMCVPHAKGSRVLDIGCGEGYAGRRMVSMGASSVIGLDISEEMVKRANENAVDGSKEAYFPGNATKLCDTLSTHTAEFHVMPGADLEMGCFDLALGVFVFNYTSIREMNQIVSQTFKVLKPNGHFVFSVPHPFMLYAHEADGQDSTFSFEQTGVTLGQYFSLRDRKFGGTIKNLEGQKLNVKMCFKTINDYVDAVKRCGFEIVDVHEANVKPEHMEQHPEFFDSVKDIPLHLVFKVRKPENVISNESSSAIDAFAKVVRWSAVEYSDPAGALIVSVPSEAQEVLRKVVFRAVDEGLDHDSYTMKSGDVEEMAAVAELGKEVRHRLLSETGAVLIRGLDMQAYGGFENHDLMVKRSKLAYFIISSFIGQVDAGARGRLFDVTDSGKSSTDDNVLFSVTSTEASWHSDGASLDRVYDVVSLMCIAPAAEGGAFKVTNSINALDTLRCKLPPFILNELFRSIPRDVLENGSGKGHTDLLTSLCRSPELLKLRVQHNAYPIYVEHPNRHRCRYMRHWIETGHKKGGVPLSPLLRLAMDALDAELDRVKIFDAPLQSGDMIFANNQVVLHARDEFKDSPAGPKRHKVRAWIQIQKVEE